jgi:hypothetical protein
MDFFERLIDLKEFQMLMSAMHVSMSGQMCAL